MAPGEDDESKTEDATPYKREEARKRGQVAQTRELSTTAIFLALAIVFYFYTSSLMKGMGEEFTKYFSSIDKFRLDDANVIALIYDIAKVGAAMLAPIFIALLVVGFMSNVLQVGFLITGEPLKFDLNKINPINGFRRYFSMNSLVETLKAVVKLTIVCAIVWVIIKKELDSAILLVDRSIPDIIRFVGSAAFKTILYVGIFMLVVAILDYLYQRMRHEKDLRMTKQEIKEEFKQREGDPNVKARIRSIQRKNATRKMIKDIPKAKVIITNPTHYAIAIQYEIGLPAPKVIAKGADFIAEKIREIAKLHNIPLVENKILARTLYKVVKVGQYVPESLYHAVAEVIAYVMKVERQAKETREKAFKEARIY